MDTRSWRAALLALCLTAALGVTAALGFSVSSADARPKPPPADQQQTSLAQAASKPQARGQARAAEVRSSVAAAQVNANAKGVNDGTKRQAAGVKLKTQKKVKPEDVLPQTGLASGCVEGYGSGAACLPLVPPSVREHVQAGHTSVAEASFAWSCVEVRQLLPDGISTQSDPLGLDADGDGTACGSSD